MLHIEIGKSIKDLENWDIRIGDVTGNVVYKNRTDAQVVKIFKEYLNAEKEYY